MQKNLSRKVEIFPSDLSRAEIQRHAVHMFVEPD